MLMNKQDYAIFPPKFHTKPCQAAPTASAGPLGMRERGESIPNKTLAFSPLLA